MQKFFFVLVFFTAFGIEQSSAARMYAKKVYSLYNETGSYVLTCKLYSNKIEITEATGTASSIRIVPTVYSGTLLSILVSRASHETLTSAPFNICDGGSLSVKAYRASGTSFTLKHFEDCGSVKKTRNGPASRSLMRIVNRYCPSYDPDKAFKQ